MARAKRSARKTPADFHYTQAQLLGAPVDAPVALHFNLRESRRRADEGADAALSGHVGMAWSAKAERWLAGRVGEFTAEDMVADIGLPSGQVGFSKNNAVGAIVRAWSQRGFIRRAGFTYSKRVESHGATISIWTPVLQAMAS